MSQQSVATWRLINLKQTARQLRFMIRSVHSFEQARRWIDELDVVESEIRRMTVPVEDSQAFRRASWLILRRLSARQHGSSFLGRLFKRSIVP